MRKVLVTGGSRGIGRAIVEKFAEMGDKVVFIYKKSDEIAKEIEKNTGALSIKADISNANEAVESINKAIKFMGGLDILVNNAGISYSGLILDTKNEDWMNVINTNLSSAFYLSREASKEMVKNHFGRIINIGSVWGNYGASCEVAYSASKSGIEGLTKALAKELGPSNITVNCIEPGVIDTEMNSVYSEEDINNLIDSTPLCRIGKPNDVAELAYFLASDKSSFITSQCIGVDGGFPLG